MGAEVLERGSCRSLRHLNNGTDAGESIQWWARQIFWFLSGSCPPMFFYLCLPLLKFVLLKLKANWWRNYSAIPWRAEEWWEWNWKQRRKWLAQWLIRSSWSKPTYISIFMFHHFPNFSPFSNTELLSIILFYCKWIDTFCSFHLQCFPVNIIIKTQLTLFYVKKSFPSTSPK